MRQPSAFTLEALTCALEIADKLSVDLEDLCFDE